MKHNLTKEIPEIGSLIDCNEKIQLLQHVLNNLYQLQSEIFIRTIEELSRYEDKQKVWFGENLIVEFKGNQYVIVGFNDNENEEMQVNPIQHIIQIKDKQTKGKEEEKEQS